MRAERDRSPSCRSARSQLFYEDIEALREQIPGIEPFEDANADYRWRAEVTRHEWKRALSGLSDRIVYDNFKNAVADRQGWERERVYHQVWGALTRLQRP
jgi:hypothetical protein